MAHGKPSTLKLGGAGGSEDANDMSFDMIRLHLQMPCVAKFFPSTDGGDTGSMFTSPIY